MTVESSTSSTKKIALKMSFGMYKYSIAMESYVEKNNVEKNKRNLLRLPICKLNMNDSASFCRHTQMLEYLNISLEQKI